MQGPCAECISDMLVGSERGKYADSAVKGEGVHLVGLLHVLLGREVLKICQYVKATNILALHRDNVVNVKANRAGCLKLPPGPQIVAYLG